MANHPSALKRHRQSLKRRARNRSNRSVLKTAVKKLQQAVAQGAPGETVETLFRAAASTIDRTAKKGVIKSRAAARKVSRLARAVSRGAQAPKPTR